MVDVLVLDEADRMIADGHFKELRHILAHVYTRRLHLKTKDIKGKKEDNKNEVLDEIFEDEEEFIEEDLDKLDSKIDWSQVKDLYDEEVIMQDVKNQGFTEDDDVEPEERKRRNKMNKKKLKMLEDDEFDKAYTKAGGIQHIICSATLTIDKKGRITPRGEERDRKAV